MDTGGQQARGRCPRPLNHFYGVAHSPTKLTDLSGFPIAAKADSFTWATATPQSGLGNSWSWIAARKSQYRALTDTDPTGRGGYLAERLVTLGFVVHLNQDLSQPSHTRNTAHPGKPLGQNPGIEKYGGDHYEANPEWFLLQNDALKGWPAWRDPGFTQLKAFWDRSKYTGASADALVRDANGVAGEKLGLAEFSNGNFLSEKATYGEYFLPRSADPKEYDLHYFPIPSLFKGTDSAEWTPSSAKPVLERNGRQVNHHYLQKDGQGIFVNKHGRLTFSCKRRSSLLILAAWK